MQSKYCLQRPREAPSKCVRNKRSRKENKAVQTILKGLHPSERIRPIFAINLTRIGNLTTYVFILTAYRWTKRVDNPIRDLNRHRVLGIFGFIWVALRERDPIYCYKCNMSGHDGHHCPRQRRLESEQPVCDGRTPPQPVHYTSNPIHRGPRNPS
jgi:hypothetical protein